MLVVANALGSDVNIEDGAPEGTCARCEITYRLPYFSTDLATRTRANVCRVCTVSMLVAKGPETVVLEEVSF